MTAAAPTLVRRRSYAIGAATATGALIGAVLWFAIARPVQVLPRMTQMPGFMLADQRKGWFGDVDLQGKLTLLSFGYTRCDTDCAPEADLLRHMRDTLAAQGLLGKRVQLVTISLDPAHDTPAALAAYAPTIGATPDTWRLLTGAPAEVRALVGGELGIYYADPVGDAPIDHTRQVLLIDQTGLIRARYDARALSEETVLRDIGLVQQEAASGELSKPMYELAHLFVCYPT